LLSAAAVLDWVTGPELASSVFYLVPIGLMTWKAGRWLGLGTAFTSGLIWLVIALLTQPRYVNEVVPYWNALVRTVMFCLVAGLGSEVLERKRVELRLRQANEALQKQTGIWESILGSMGDGVVVADAQGKLLHINPAAARLLRLPPGETDVAGWLDRQETFAEGPSGAGGRGNPLRRAIRGESVDEAELFLPNADLQGGTWLSAAARPLEDGGKAIVGGVMVLSDITARREVERQIAEASDREQRRLGEDLHDGLCQQLVSTAFAARKLAAKLGERSSAEAEEANEIAELLGDAIGQARDVARGLYLVPPEVGGLASALDELALQVRSRHCCGCSFTSKSPIPLLEETVATNLFRIAQEAVTNALKHSRPSQISICLEGNGEKLALRVENDGAGFSPGGKRTRGLGLRMMNYRARLVGAALEIGPRPGGGTVVTCNLRQANSSSSNARNHAAA
jgi:signal transduction histidine kinase